MSQSEHREQRLICCIGTSNRRRIFLEWNESGKAAGLPQSVFCKGTADLSMFLHHSQPSADLTSISVNRITLSSWGTLTETHFYNKIRPTLDIEAPKSYFAAFDPVRYTSIIMLADLAGQVEFCNSNTDVTLEMIRSQLRVLAHLHGRYYKNVGDLENLATFYGRTEMPSP
jgi:hypothetical protein